MPDVNQAGLGFRVLSRGKNKECEIGIFPFATRLPHQIDEFSTHCSYLPVKFPHFKGQKNDANYETLPPSLSFSSNFSSLKALLLRYASPLDFFSLSGAEVIIYVSKNPSTFSVPLLCRRRRLSFVTLPSAQFSWVLFIPRDKSREEKK